jgi:nitrite reductase (NADH) small subunit
MTHPTQWIEIARLDDIPRQGSRVVTFKDARLALFRTVTDTVYALNDRCPHRGGRLSDGIVHGERVTCPLHGFKIDLASGEAVLPDTGCAHTWPVRVESGGVWLGQHEPHPEA